MTTELTLTCGFSEISGLSFRKDIQRKGQEIQPHIFNVREVRKNGEIEIFAHCVPETSITKSPYIINFVICPKSRKVMSAICSCVAGGEGMCKHSAGVYYNVNSERTEGCTDKEQGWQKPSERHKKVYPKGEPIQRTFFNRDPITR